MRPRGQVWWREVFEGDLTAEDFWLAAEVYGSGKGARGSGPRMTARMALERYRAEAAAARLPRP